MSKKNIFKSKQLYIWFFSYLSIILLCVAISCILHFTSVGTLRDQIEKNMQFTIEQMHLFYDADLLNVQNTTYNILEGQNVQRLAAIGLKEQPSERTAQYKDICQSISSAFNSSPKIKNFFLVFEDYDLTFDHIGQSSKHALYSRYFHPYYASAKDWLDDISSIEAYSDYKLLTDRDGKTQICYVQRTPVTIHTPAKAVAVVILDADQIFKEQLNFAKATEPIMVILGREGETIFSSAPDKNFSYTDVNKKDYITTTIDSSFNNWQYVLMIPHAAVYASLNRLQIAAFFCYLACLTAGIALSYYFAKKNYQPLSRLMTMFSSTHIQNTKSEFLYLEDNISQILEKNKKIKKEFDSELAKLRELYLSNLVLGHVEESNRSRFYRPEFSEAYFNVVLFHVSDCGVLNAPNHEAGDSLASVYFAIENVFSEIMEPLGKCYFFRCEGMYACIVNSGKENPELDICSQTEFTIQFMHENFATQIISAVSDTAESESQLPTLYRQTKDIISINPYSASGSVLVSKDLEDAAYIYSHETELMLITHLKRGDYENAAALLDEIIKTNTEERKLSPSLRQILLCNLVGTMLKVSVDVGENKQIFSTMYEIINAEDIKKAKKLLLGYMQVLCDNIIQNDRNIDERIEQIIAFVHDNYCDPNLNVSYVANKFDITINYLSSYFKAKTGQVLSDYILKYRLEKACELLTAKVKVTETCRLCGFYDVNAFIRSFKKVYGVTPGKYGK